MSAVPQGSGLLLSQGGRSEGGWPEHFEYLLFFVAFLDSMGSGLSP